MRHSGGPSRVRLGAFIGNYCFCSKNYVFLQCASKNYFLIKTIDLMSFLDPSLREANLSVLYTILFFCKQTCDFESHRVIYNSTFLTQKCTLGSHRVIYNSTFQSVSGGSRIANRQYRTHARTRADPPRGVPGGELLLKTIDHKGPKLPTGRPTPIRDFDPTSLP